MAIIKPTLNLVASEYTPEILNVTRASGATRVNAAGLVERVSAGTLRYDYDPTTLAGKGWLIEEARTNIIIQSENLQTNWTAQNVGFGTKGTAPDGKTTAELVDDTSGTASNHSVYYSYSFTSGTSYTLSAWFKVSSGSHGWLQMPNSAFPGNIAAEFDITNLTSVDISDSGASAESITMVEYPNGWVRCSITDTADATTSGNVQMGLNDGNGTSSAFTGSGLSMYMWGIQLEAGSFATSYIPTTTAAVTRAKDLVSASLSDIDYMQDPFSGTLYVHGSFVNNGASIANLALATLYEDGSNYISFMQLSNSILLKGYDGGSKLFELTLISAALVSATDYRFAISFDTDDIAAVVDGGTVQTDVSATIADGVIDLYLGSLGGGQTQYAHIKHIALFNTDMSDADIQTITTG